MATGHHRRCTQVAVWCLAGVVAWQLPAQTRPADEQAPPQEPILRLARPDLDQARLAFWLADLNGDDRIVYREARRCFTDVEGLDGFRRYDLDRDGLVHFDEFRARFDDVLRHRVAFVLRGPAAIRHAPLDPTAPRAAEEALASFILRQLDANRDGRLDPSEWSTLVTMIGSLGAARQIFDEADSDQSRDLNVTELAPIAQRLWQVTGGGRPRPERNPAMPQLPKPLADADADLDDNVDGRELAYALRRVDPLLARFADEILERVDSNGDGRIGAREAALIPGR